MYTNLMHRTQIYLDGQHYQLLRSRAQREGKTIASIVREILDQHFGLKGGSDPLARVIGIGKGDGAAVAEHYENYLYGEQD